MVRKSYTRITPDCAICKLDKNEAFNNMSRTNASLQQAKAKVSALECVLNTHRGKFEKVLETVKSNYKHS